METKINSQIANFQINTATESSGNSREDILLIEEELRLDSSDVISLGEIAKNISEEDLQYVRDFWDHASNLPLLTDEETITLIREYQNIISNPDSDKCPELINRADQIVTDLTSHNSRLIFWQVRKYIGQLTRVGMTLRDGLQEGSIGLLKAIKKCNTEQNTKFSSYAIWSIRQSILRATQNFDIIRIPVSQQEMLYHLSHVISQTGFSHRPTSSFSDEDITIMAETARKLDYPRLTAESIKTLLSIKNISVFSLDNPVYPNEDITLEDIICDKSPHLEETILIPRSTDENFVDSVLSQLTTREEQVIRLLHGLPYGMRSQETRSLQEVGDIFKFSRERIRQISDKAKTKIRNILMNLTEEELQNIHNNGYNIQCLEDEMD